jgi:hypothetical protein
MSRLEKAEIERLDRVADAIRRALYPTCPVFKSVSELPEAYRWHWRNAAIAGLAAGEIQDEKPTAEAHIEADPAHASIRVA